MGKCCLPYACMDVKWNSLMYVSEVSDSTGLENSRNKSKICHCAWERRWNKNVRLYFMHNIQTDNFAKYGWKMGAWSLF